MRQSTNPTEQSLEARPDRLTLLVAVCSHHLDDRLLIRSCNDGEITYQWRPLQINKKESDERSREVYHVSTRLPTETL